LIRTRFQGQGQSRVAGFNARNLSPQTTQLRPWLPDEQALTLCANSGRPDAGRSGAL